MKVVYVVTRSDEIGGAQIHVRDLATRLSRKGHEVIVVAGGNGLLFEHLQQLNIPYYRLPSLIRPIRPVKELEALYHLIRLLRRECPDLVSLHSSKSGLLGRIASFPAKAPAVFTAHGWAFTEGTPRMPRLFYMALEKMAAPLARRLITVSRFDRELAQECRVGKPEQLITIHNGMPDIAEELLATPEKEPVRMVMVARFSGQKDHQTLLQALAQIGTSQEWSLELIGTGPGREEVARQVRDLGFEDRVEFAGEVDDVAQRLAHGQLFILTSNWEGLPRSIIEAMRAGLPVVASDVGGVSEMVRDGENGFLVEPGNVEQLSERLRELMADSELRKRMGRRSRDCYEKGFRFEEMVENTLEVYRAVVDEARGKDKKRKKLPTE